MCYRCATMAREWTKKIWSRRRRMACAACANGLSNSAATSQYRVSPGAEPRWSRRYRRHDHLISFEQATANDRAGYGERSRWDLTASRSKKSRSLPGFRLLSPAHLAGQRAALAIETGAAPAYLQKSASDES